MQFANLGSIKYIYYSLFYCPHRTVAAFEFLTSPSSLFQAQCGRSKCFQLQFFTSVHRCYFSSPANLLRVSPFLLVSFQVSPLFQKLETDQIEALKKKFGGQQVFDRS